MNTWCVKVEAVELVSITDLSPSELIWDKLELRLLKLNKHVSPQLGSKNLLNSLPGKVELIIKAGGGVNKSGMGVFNMYSCVRWSGVHILLGI